MVSNSALRAGMKVVCIDDSGLMESRRWLKLNGIYTIAHWTPDGEFVDLLEDPDLHPDRGYNPSRFRPLVTRTQEDDVGMFKELTSDIPPSARLDLLAELLNQ